MEALTLFSSGANVFLVDELHTKLVRVFESDIEVKREIKRESFGV